MRFRTLAQEACQRVQSLVQRGRIGVQHSFAEQAHCRHVRPFEAGSNISGLGTTMARELTILVEDWVVLIKHLVTLVPNIFKRCTTDFPIGVFHSLNNGQLFCIVQLLLFIVCHLACCFPRRGRSVKSADLRKRVRCVSSVKLSANQARACKTRCVNSVARNNRLVRPRLEVDNRLKHATPPSSCGTGQ
jgi:hypothetical protein